MHFNNHIYLFCFFKFSFIIICLYVFSAQNDVLFLNSFRSQSSSTYLSFCCTPYLHYLHLNSTNTMSTLSHNNQSHYIKVRSQHYSFYYLLRLTHCYAIPKLLVSTLPTHWVSRALYVFTQCMQRNLLFIT